MVALLVPWLPPNASKERDGIDLVFWFTTVICIGVFALVVAVIAYSVLHFRARPDDDSDGPPIHGHTGLEIVWTAVPAMLVTAISIISGIVLVQNDRRRRERAERERDRAAVRVDVRVPGQGPHHLRAAPASRSAARSSCT